MWTLTFGLAARLAFAAACVGDISMLHAGALLTSPLLPPLNVLLQWMATQQDIFRQVQSMHAAVCACQVVWNADSHHGTSPLWHAVLFNVLIPEPFNAILAWAPLLQEAYHGTFKASRKYALLQGLARELRWSMQISM